MQNETDKPRKNWWGRNWLWVVPTGCLTAIVVVVAIPVLLVVLVFGFLKSNNAYTGSLAIVEADAAVQSALGMPIEAGWLVSGSINVSGGSGDADLSYDVAGPQGRATVYVTAQRQAGTWQYDSLRVHLHADDRELDLLAPAGPAVTPLPGSSPQMPNAPPADCGMQSSPI